MFPYKFEFYSVFKCKNRTVCQWTHQSSIIRCCIRPFSLSFNKVVSFNKDWLVSLPTILPLSTHLSINGLHNTFIPTSLSCSLFLPSTNIQSLKTFSKTLFIFNLRAHTHDLCTPQAHCGFDAVIHAPY